MTVQFSLRTLLVLTLFVAILVAWWVDRSKLTNRNDSLANTVSEMKLSNDNLANQISGLNMRIDKLRMQVSLWKQEARLNQPLPETLQLQAKLYELEFKYGALAKKVREEEGLDFVRLLFSDDNKTADYSTELYNQIEQFGVE